MAKQQTTSPEGIDQADQASETESTTEEVPQGTRRSEDTLSWRCAYTGRVFSMAELAGYGTPPRSPNTPPGHGAGLAMMPVSTRTDYDIDGRELRVSDRGTGEVYKTA